MLAGGYWTPQFMVDRVSNKPTGLLLCAMALLYYYIHTRCDCKSKLFTFVPVAQNKVNPTNFYFFLVSIYRWTWCHPEKDVHQMGQQTPQKGRQIILVCRDHLSRNFCRRYGRPSSSSRFAPFLCSVCRRIYDPLEHESHFYGSFFLSSGLGLWVKGIWPKGNVFSIVEHVEFSVPWNVSAAAVFIRIHVTFSEIFSRFSSTRATTSFHLKQSTGFFLLFLFFFSAFKFQSWISIHFGMSRSNLRSS